MTDCGAEPLLRGLQGDPGMRGLCGAAPRAAALGWTLGVEPPSLAEWRLRVGLVGFFGFGRFFRLFFVWGCRVFVVLFICCFFVWFCGFFWFVFFFQRLFAVLEGFFFTRF